MRIKALLRSACKSGFHSRGFSAPWQPLWLRWIQPVVPDQPVVGLLHLPVETPLPRWSRVRSGGVDFRHLRPLAHTSKPDREEMTLRLSLFNARSLANKTSVLNDFFTSCELDFMLLMETWLHVGESTPFSELLPPDCLFFNSPRSTGRGGGLATVFKSNFQCRQAQSDSSSSFELQTFVINLNFPVLCALICRPPQFNKDFIQDFSDFVAGLILNYDYFLIAGDFNIHVCCESRPLVNEFLNLVDSFNLTQSVSGPTHEKGHTLDLVLSFSLSVCVSEICDMRISDHFPVLFNVTLPCSQVKLRAPRCRVCTINALTASRLSAAFKDSLLYSRDHYCHLSPDEFIAVFNSSCVDLLDLVAPLRIKRPRQVTEPWLNDVTRSLRRTCRRAERKWKKDHLQVSLDILRTSLLEYQRAIKTAKTQFLSNLVSSNSHKPVS